MNLTKYFFLLFTFCSILAVGAQNQVTSKNYASVSSHKEPRGSKREASVQEGKITGTIKDTKGKPVTFATLQIAGINQTTHSDGNGEFEFVKIPYGKYELHTFSLEIQKTKFDVELNSKSKPLALVVQPSNIDLEEVVIDGMSKKKEIETKGYAATVIETQQIAVQSVQVNELLDRTAGVKIRQDGGLGSHTHYSINGLSGNAIKIFIDGVPAANYGSSFSLSSIPPALIERIEVYKGVVPGYLAEDALGGAINVVLKQRRKSTLTTSYSIGSFNTHQWNMTGNHRWQNGLTIDGSAFYNYSDNDYKVWGDDVFFVDYTGSITESNGKKVKRFHDAYKSIGGKFQFGFTDTKWADQLFIGTVLSKDYNENQHGATMRVVYGDRHNRGESRILSLVYDKKDILIKGVSLKIDATHSYLKRQVIDTVGIMHDWNGPIKYPDGSYVKYINGAESGSAKTAGINKDYSDVIRTNLNYQINDNHRFYSSYLFNNFERKILDKYKVAALQKLENTRDLRKDIISITYENLSFSEKLRTSVFYKHYFQKVTSNEPKLENKEYKVNKTVKEIDYGSYGLTISYALFPNLYLLGSIERAVRLPSEREMFGNDATNLSPSIGLNPEKSINTNVGLNFGSYSIGKHSLSLNAFVYYRDTQDMIKEAFGYGSFEFSQFKNYEDILTKGIDAELNYNYADKINIRFNVSKFEILSNTKFIDGQINSHYRDQIPNEPSFKFNLNTTYYQNNLFLKGSKASVYYNLNYVGDFLRYWGDAGTSNLSRVPIQYPMDLGLTYTFPNHKFVLSFDAKNIMDKQVFDNFGLQKAGRAFYSKITYFIF